MDVKKSVRKISIGKDYLNAMHFQVGSYANRKKTLTISDIIFDGKEFVVYVKNRDLTQEWKVFRSEAVSHYELNVEDDE